MKRELGIKDIIIVILIMLLFVIIGFFFFYLNKDDSNDIPQPKEIEAISTYKTNDDRFILKIVERTNEEASANARLRYGENTFNEIIKPNVRLYAYLNNRVFAIDEIKEDDNYALYSFIGLPNEEYGHKILVNKKNNIIEVSENDLKKVDNSCLNNGFCGFQDQPSYIKSSTGYYFINNNKGLIIVYTTQWQNIGYLDKMQNLKLDGDGSIYLYENVKKANCNGNYCEYEGIGELIKYDVNGNKK